jgi:hypothetical protein
VKGTNLTGSVRLVVVVPPGCFSTSGKILQGRGAVRRDYHSPTGLELFD